MVEIDVRRENSLFEGIERLARVERRVFRDENIEIAAIGVGVHGDARRRHIHADQGGDLVIPMKSLRIVRQRLRRARPGFAAFHEVPRRFAMHPIACPEREADQADRSEQASSFGRMHACREHERQREKEPTRPQWWGRTRLIWGTGPVLCNAIFLLGHCAVHNSIIYELLYATFPHKAEPRKGQ
jgi:hypothetical protein